MFQLLREPVDEATEDQVQLAVADTAHHAGGHLVGVDAAPFETHVGNVCKGHLCSLDRSELQREHAVICVGADIAGRLERQRCNRPVVLCTYRSLVAHVLSPVMERLPARVPEPYRPSRSLGQKCCEEKERLVTGVTAAELTTHIRTHDSHAVQWHVKHLADMHARLMRLVRVRPDSDVSRFHSMRQFQLSRLFCVALW